MKYPQDYPRRVLLTVAGSTPAIVTETLYALTQTAEQPFIPTEIHIITTKGVYQHLKESLLGKKGKIKQLCEDYDIPAIHFNEDCIHPIVDQQSVALDDITSDQDNQITADFITRKVRELTADEDTSLHVSIAGGRKTMTYYLGYAMSVFGRIQDTMSHVLVKDTYCAKDFYYPPPKPLQLKNYQGECFDASQVEVMLASLPYVRLRDGLTDDFLNDKTKSYSEIIEIAQRQLIPLRVELTEQDIIICGGREVRLAAVELSFYLWFLYRRQNNKDPIQLTSKEQKINYTKEFLSFYELCSGGSEHYYLLKDNTFQPNTPMDSKYVSERRSKINKVIEEALGKPAAAPYLIESSGKKGSMAYHLSKRLKARHIDIDFQ